MAWTWSELMVQMNTYHALAREDWYDAEEDIEVADDEWWGGNDHWALFRAIQAGLHLVDLTLHSNFWYVYGLNGFDSMTEALFKLTDERIEGAGGDVTMRSILDAMFTADGYELMQFVGLVDAYRQSIWNKPFDADLWAAYARGFEGWE